MKHTISNHPGKTDKPRACPLVEQTIERKKTTSSSLQSSFLTLQEKGCYHVSSVEGKKQKHCNPSAEEKREKRCIPYCFVALALLLGFASLCVLSLSRIPPVALDDTTPPAAVGTA